MAMLESVGVEASGLGTVVLLLLIILILLGLWALGFLWLRFCLLGDGSAGCWMMDHHSVRLAGEERGHGARKGNQGAESEEEQAETSRNKSRSVYLGQYCKSHRPVNRENLALRISTHDSISSRPQMQMQSISLSVDRESVGIKPISHHATLRQPCQPFPSMIQSPNPTHITQYTYIRPIKHHPSFPLFSSDSISFPVLFPPSPPSFTHLPHPTSAHLTSPKPSRLSNPYLPDPTPALSPPDPPAPPPSPPASPRPRLAVQPAPARARRCVPARWPSYRGG